MNFQSYHLFRTGNNELLYIVPLNAVTLANCVRGLRVKRGRDWFYGKQDYAFGAPSYGKIRNCKNNEWADVEFPGINNTYPIGAGGIYSLKIPKSMYLEPLK